MTAVTVAQLVAEVVDRCGLALVDVGLFLDGPAGTTRAVQAGLRKGLADVSLSTASPFALADADVAPLTRFAVERVVDVAELHALRLALRHWHRAMESEGVAAVEKADDVRGGTLWERRQSAKDRVAQLAADLAAPYREPASDIVVVAADPADVDPAFPWPFGCSYGGWYP